MALSEDFLYQLKQLNPIESVMSSYVTLHKRGRNFTCLCPFHSEKSASCTVYPDTDSFYCFGCGAGGDAITFIKKIENLEYIEAVKLLAEKAGLSMPEDASDNSYARVKARILEINREAARFFYSQLSSKSGSKGLMYFASRGISPQTIKKYGLGYAPDGWDNLTRHLTSLGYKEDELAAASLASPRKNGNGVYDAFRDRAIFPIIDLRGNIIAFGGRIIDGSGPKYLNSGDTPVFKKSRNLFSLNFAKNTKESRLILAEGYMDVISINQAGFENVVATLGTALTGEQARLMSQYAKEVVIAYDSDGPGQAATHKAINLLSEAGVATKIIKMNGAKDPDEFIKKFGATRFKLLMEQSEGAIHFELEKCKNGIDIETDQGRVEYLKRAARVLADISSPVERDVYISRVANSMEISKDNLRIQVNGIIKKRINTQKKKDWSEIAALDRKRDALMPEAMDYPKEVRAEQGIIAYLFRHPDKLSEVTEKLPPEKFVTELHRKIYIVLTEKLRTNSDFSLTSLSGELNSDEMGKISEILAKSKDISITSVEAEDYIKLLVERRKKPSDGQITDGDLLELQKRLQSKYSRT